MGRDELNTVSFAFVAWKLCRETRICITFNCPEKNYDRWIAVYSDSLVVYLPLSPSLSAVWSTWATQAWWGCHRQYQAKDPTKRSNSSFSCLFGGICSCGFIYWIQWSHRSSESFEELVPYHSVKMENKCKENGHGNAGQVERTEINTSADLLLTASGQYSWKVKRMISTSVKNSPYRITLAIRSGLRMLESRVLTHSSSVKWTLPDRELWSPSVKNDIARTGIIFAMYVMTSGSLLYR